MKKRHFLILLLALSCLFAIFAAACQPGNNDDDNDNGDNNSEVTSIEDVARSGKDGTEYTIEGVVYGIVSDGYFIADDTAGIFVSGASQVSVGDKLSVKATLSVNSNVPSLTSATATTVATGQTALAPAASSLSELNSFSAGRANYYKYLTVAGTLSYTDGTYLLTEGIDRFEFDERSNTQHLEAWVGQKIDISVITTGFGTYWTGVFIGGADDIKEHYVDLDAVKDDILASFTIPEVVYLSLDLPTSYTLEPNVKFEWSVVSGEDNISITDNVAEITPGAGDSTIVIRLTLSADEQKVTQDYTIMVNAAELVGLDELADYTTENVMIEGRVIAKGFAQTQYRVSMLITDGTNNVAVDIDRNDIDYYNLGDTVRAVGTYTPATGIFAAHFEAIDYLCSQPAESGYSVDYSKLDATELRTVEDYQAVIDNPGGNGNRLYKIVMPYMILSGNTSYNFVRFGATAETAAGGYDSNPEGFTGSSNWYFCFAINSMNYSVPGFYDLITPPFLQDGADYYGYLTIYAYAMFDGGSTGSSTWQFVIPEDSAIVIDEEALVVSKIDSEIGETTVVATEGGTINIPQSIAVMSLDGSVQDVAVSWTSSNPEVLNAQTGVFNAVTSNQTVTLTAKWTYKGVEGEHVVTINLLANDLESITVTEWLTTPDNELPDLFYLEATVAAYGSTSNNTDDARNGLILTDGVNTMWYKTDVYTYTSNGSEVAIAMGDTVRISGATLDRSNGNQALSGGTMEVLSSGNNIDYTDINLYGDVSSDEELSALAAGMDAPLGGVIVEFSGVFSFVGTGSTNCRYQLNYKNATSSAAARYLFGDGNDRTFSFSVSANSLTFPDWYVDCGLPEGQSKTCFPVEGTIVAVSCSYGATMYAWSIIAIDCKPYVPEGDLNNILTVSEALEDTSGEAVYVQGVIGAFGGQTASGQGDGFQKGLILTDGTNILLVDDLGDNYRVGEDGAYTINGKALAVGDEVRILGMVSGTSMSVSTIEVISSGNTVSWSTNAAVTIQSDADLTAFANDIQVGVLVKFVGTEENPFFFGGSGSNSGAEGCNYKLHYKNDSTITTNAGVQYNDRNFAFKGGSNEYLMGEMWWSSKLGLPDGGFVCPNGENPANKYGYVGTFYAVVTASSSSYYQLIFVNVDEFDVTPLTTAEA